MGAPVSVRLDEAVQSTLEGAARERGIGLSTYLRDLATAEAKRVRREKIRAETQRVAAYIARSPEAQAFCAAWGTPAPIHDRE
ncbi:hypothetical protein [Belnapia rosea]|uniref:Ribbon-helix-helix protein, copG family n=1 Tax=Belnapia rosea TaxID=938405 RepID=A0A1G6UAK0_9PROT|nr:hypothetical protein [Belnapia rosea]SDD38311.1 hypothetical protein SAMN04487779_1007102 [Belnapia rosea]